MRSQKREVLQKGAGLLLEKEKLEGAELKALMERAATKTPGASRQSVEEMFDR